MKMISLILVSLMTLLSVACSEDKDQPTPEQVLPDRNSVKYSGAIMLELGSIEGHLKLFSDDKRKAHVRLYFCVDKDRATEQSGTLSIKYSDYEIFGESDSAWDQQTRKRVRVIKDSVEIEYNMNGWIEDSVIGGYEGQFNFETKVVNTTWRELKEDGRIGDILDPSKISFGTWRDMRGNIIKDDFDIKITPNYLALFGAKSYAHDDQNYYLSNRLMYTIVNKTHGVNLVDICEQQDEDIVIVEP